MMRTPNFKTIAKITFLAAAITLAGAHEAPAQDDPAADSWSVSLMAKGIGGDNGYGAAVQTPSFLGQNGRLRFDYARMGIDAIPTNAALFDELNYSLLQAHYIGYFSRPVTGLRGYWGAGVGYVMADDLITTDDGFTFDLLVGIEVGSAESGSLGSFAGFLETGYMVNPDRAEALPGDPQFANGVILAGGVRFYF